MNQIFYSLALFFSFFPYLQIISLETYTQPYYVIFGVIAFTLLSKSTIRNFPISHAYSLIAFACFGLIGFSVATLQSISMEEIKALLQYTAPLFLVPLSYFLTIKNSKRFRKQTMIAILIWLGVATIQFFVEPTFATNLTGKWGIESAEVVIDSGRGVLSLAPEPTHFALHVFALLALAMILGESKHRLLTGLVLLIVFSASTTLVLIIVLTMLIMFFRTRVLKKRELISLSLLTFMLITGFLLVDQNSRIYQLINLIASSPMTVFELDGSANARASGIILGSQAILDNCFFPHGLSNTDWLAAQDKLIANSSFFHSLSSSGIASGYLRPVYEIGFFAIPFFILFIRTTLAYPQNQIERLIIIGFVIVFSMQFLISSPLFGLVYGAILARQKERHELEELKRVV